METVQSPDGTEIAFETGGSGPNLLFVHGSSASHARWRGIRPALERDFTVVAIDRRGRGESGDADAYALARESEDILAVIDRLSGPILLFGHSFGAICSLEAATHTDRLAGLMLYEPPLKGEAAPDALTRMETMLAAGDREGVATYFMRDVVGLTDDAFAAMRALPSWPQRVASVHTLPREMRAIGTYRVDAVGLRRLSIPVALLLGGASPPHFDAAIAMLTGLLPDTRTVDLPGQGHSAMDTAPDMLIETIRDFWREIGGRS